MVRISQHQLLSLSHVCSSWHTVILGTPSLWATVELNLMTTYPISTATLDRIRRRISLSLERSHKHPLYIHLRITRPEDARVILPLLVQHSARWRILDMHITHSIVQFLSAAKGNLPLLEYLKLGGVQRHPAILDVFQNAPKLTRVKVWGPDTASLGLPFGQLSSITYLCQRGVRAIPEGIADIRHCSSQCKISIRNLDITHVPIPIHDFAPIRSNIVHLHLEIRDRKSAEHSREVVGAILRSLTLPCLTGLILRPPPGSRPYYWPREAFSAFASQSLCRENLTELSLEDMVITEDDLVACLVNMPALNDLVLSDVPRRKQVNILITNSLVRRLCWIPTASCLVPRLHHIILDSFDDNVLLEFVISRLGPGRLNDQPFDIELNALEGPAGIRDIDSKVLATIEDAVSHDELDWWCE
ncbi:hypothetical protein DFH06DRAFT_1442162 [Mycena polygramma]|nr:hypothetical protein DFH06DRAFT_1442162 [Mycena polygramma]